MIAEQRGAFFLVALFVFFIAIIGLFAVSTVKRPGRWSKRLKMRVEGMARSRPSTSSRRLTGLRKDRIG